jgi:hypothetical protein
MTPAVACSQAGDANQSLNRLRLHRINDDASGSEKRRVPLKISTEFGDTPSVYDRIHACQSMFNRVLIKGIAV